MQGEPHGKPVARDSISRSRPLAGRCVFLGGRGWGRLWAEFHLVGLQECVRVLGERLEVWVFVKFATLVEDGAYMAYLLVLRVPSGFNSEFGF